MTQGRTLAASPDKNDFDMFDVIFVCFSNRLSFFSVEKCGVHIFLGNGG